MSSVASLINAGGSSKGATSTDTSTMATEQSSSDPFLLMNAEEFEWEAYESTYRDRALITRLLHFYSVLSTIPPSPTTTAMAKSALLRLIPLVKRTMDTATYLSVIHHLDSIAHSSKPSIGGVDGDEAVDDEVMEEDYPLGDESDGVPDAEWVETTRENERKENTKLDIELRGYNSNLIKESIRLTLLAFAQLSVNAGKPQDALKRYNEARDYSSSPSHLVDLGTGIIETSLAFNIPQHVIGQVHKLEASLDRAYPLPSTNRTDHAGTTAADLRETREKEARSATMRKVINTKLRVARGIVALSHKDWENAGRELGEVLEEGGLGDWEGQAISTSDLALVTALCTLATSNRERIRRVLLDRTSFRSAVDDSNRWISELVRAFIDAQYGSVLTLLRKYEAMILLNPFLSSHTSTLTSLIRTRAIIQYVSPFSSVSITAMAAAFAMSEEEMLKEVEILVEKGKIKGRIDLIDMVIQVKQPNPRNELFGTALKAGMQTSENTKAALIRMRIHEAGIKVDPRPAEERENGAIGGFHGTSSNMPLEADEPIVVD